MLRNPGRVQRDFIELFNNDISFARVIPAPSGDIEMKKFYVEIDGPEETPYITGKFVININVPVNFPIDPPVVTMVTKVWHPNIALSGKICVDILDDEWAPGMTLLEVIEGIRGLLAFPNPDSPLNVEAGNMMRTDISAFKGIALAYTCTHAKGTITDAFIEDQLLALTALGMTREVALQRLAMNKADGQRVADLYGNL